MECEGGKVRGKGREGREGGREGKGGRRMKRERVKGREAREKEWRDRGLGIKVLLKYKCIIGKQLNMKFLQSIPIHSPSNCIMSLIDMVH